MVVGDTVMCYAAKQMDKYDKRKAKVEWLNTHQAAITMLEGLAQGEKRKVEYKWLELWPYSNKLSPGVSPPASLRKHPSAPGLARPMEESPSAPYSMCKDVIGDLSMMD